MGMSLFLCQFTLGHTPGVYLDILEIKHCNTKEIKFHVWASVSVRQYMGRCQEMEGGGGSISLDFTVKGAAAAEISDYNQRGYDIILWI